MKLNIKADSDLKNGINRLARLLDIELGDGIEVSAVCAERIGASLKDGVGTIYYKEKHHFFRELGVFVENARRSDSFDITENGFFKTVGLMYNATHASCTVAAFSEYLDYMALMGYNLVMLYTEDNFYLENRPHFGYMQGKYTREELKALDDYAYDYGIEMIPCIECYGHMQNYLYWDEAAGIKDTPTVLLAREEKTFEFLEELIRESVAPLRSKRIHIGMDEAWNMGRGKFMDKNGFVPPFEIFKEFMERLVSITEKYGLVPMMWSDMYMRHASETGWPYDEKIVVTDEMRASIPEGVELVFWHYGEDPGCDEYMLEKYNQIGRKTIMATGIWDWSTKLPDNIYTYEATKASLDACRKTGVVDMMTTKWGSIDMWTTLLGISLTAELCYNENAGEREIKERFDFLTDGAYDAFAAMGQFNNIFDSEHTYPDYSTRFLGHALYWQDILEGTYDSHLLDRPMSAHYAAMAEKLSGYEGKFKDSVEYARAIFSVAAKKTEIAERLWKAYKKGDRATLSDIRDNLLPELITRLESAYEAEVSSFLRNNKQANLCGIDKNYGYLIFRARTAIRLLTQYLNGEIAAIDGLEEPRLERKVNGFLPVKTISSAIP